MLAVLGTLLIAVALVFNGLTRQVDAETMMLRGCYILISGGLGVVFWIVQIVKWAVE